MIPIARVGVMVMNSRSARKEVKPNKMTAPIGPLRIASEKDSDHYPPGAHSRVEVGYGLSIAGVAGPA